jgi:hypothetical protein
MPSLLTVFIDILWVSGIILAWSLVCHMTEKVFPTMDNHPILTGFIGVLIITPVSPGISVTLIWLAIAAWVMHWGTLKLKLLDTFEWLTGLTAHLIMAFIAVLFIMVSYHYFVV